MIRIFAILLFSIILTANVCGQEQKSITVPAIVFQGDTIPYITLSPVRIYGKRTFKSKKDQKRWNKLIRDVKKVYPYAVVSSIKLKQYNEIISKIKDEDKRKDAMKEAEKEIRKQFENDMKDMTFTQGKILLKLIDRQTGYSSYQIIKELRGALYAFFWQGVARVFGLNLKSQYDLNSDDKYIEEIIILIENGDL